MALNSIVLSDDESIQRDTLSTIIQRYVSADIRLCSNGRDALSLIEEELPDLLITDIRMPVMDGMELIKEVSSRYPSLKTVLISAYSEFSYAKTAITCGVSEYLLKPFRPEEIRKLLEKLDAEISAAQAQSLWDRLQKKASTNQQLMALSASLYGLPLPAGKETDLSALVPPRGHLLLFRWKSRQNHGVAKSPAPGNVLTDRQQELRLIHENYEISLREKETQLMALTMQINPHFLYNTLNTINMLAIQNDDDETAELIVSLSEMLQYTCKDSSDQAPLSAEISWVSNYLFLMSKRYNGLFRTVLDIDEDLMDCRIPKFILQPLVENSILHGFSDMQKEGVLTLAISKSENSLCIEVRDNGIGMDEEQLKKYIHAICVDGHVGISNVHRRLSLIYGENYKIHVVSAPGEGTSIKIWIPVEY